MISVGLSIEAIVSSTSLPAPNVVFVSITGLTDGYALIDTPALIGASLSNAEPITAYRWGSAPGGAEFGTGASPANLATLPQGGVLYLQATADSGTYSGFAVAYALPTVSEVIADQQLVLGEGNITIDLRGIFANATEYLVTGAGASLDADGYTLRLADDLARAGVLITATGTNPASSTETAFLLTVTEPILAETLTFLQIDGSQTGGDLSVSYTISGTSGVTWGVGTGAPPSAAALRAGTGMVDFGTTTLDVSGSLITFSLEDDIDETGLNLWVVTDDSDAVVTATGSVPFAIDTTAPALLPASCSPVEGATDIAVDSAVTLIFDETVVAGTGNFYIYEDAVLSETITVGAATIGTTDVVLNPLGEFSDNVDVSVRWDAGVLEDAQGNIIAENATNTLLNFTTVSAGLTSPDQISGLNIWVDPSDAATVTVEGGTPNQVTRAENKRATTTEGDLSAALSGNTNMRWGGPTNDTINGLTAFDTTPNAAFRIDSTLNPPIDVTEDFTLALVLYFETARSSSATVIGFESAPGNEAFLELEAASGQLRIDGNHTQTNFNLGNQEGNTFLLMLDYNGTAGTVDAWIGGVYALASQITNYVPATDRAAFWGLNRWPKGSNGNQNAYGDICQYNRLLTTQEKNDLGNHLATKWGVSWMDIV